MVCALLACALLPQTAQAQLERLVGGHAARPGKWPFQAFIYIGEGSGGYCGGTLIAPRWVLTAGHCVVNTMTGAVRGPEIFAIRLGSVHRSQGGEVRRVVRVVPHEAFGPNLQNDIALLELDAPSSLPAVALEGVSPSSGQRSIKADASPWATVIGWGLIDPVTRQGVDLLQEASLPLVDAERCNRSLSPKLIELGRIDERRVCAGLSEGGIDTCNGDSGGPLLIADGEGGSIQVGLVSYGEIQCGKANSFGVYTRVAAFSDWVARAMSGDVRPAAAAPPAPLALGATASAPTVMANAAEEKGVVRVAMSRRDLPLGTRFELAVVADFDGYLVLFDQNERNEITQLFPNPRSAVANKDGRIRRGAPLRLPDPTYGFAFEASEPVGRGRILALVVSDPAMLRGVGAKEGFRILTDAEARFAELERFLTAERGDRGGAPLKWGAAFVDYLVR